MQLVTNDNLDLGCAVIEQAATDKVPFLALMYTYSTILFLPLGVFVVLSDVQCVNYISCLHWLMSLSLSYFWCSCQISEVA